MEIPKLQDELRVHAIANYSSGIVELITLLVAKKQTTRIPVLDRLQMAVLDRLQM
ncbi:Hypothetical predicted protein, partial [Paramuricea clavata]